MNFSIEYMFKHPKSQLKIRFVSDPVSLNEALFTAKDLEKTGRVSDLVFIDSKGVS